MKTIKLTAIAFLVAITHVVLAATAQQQLVSLLQRYKTYQANFKQTTDSGSKQKARTGNGRVMIVRPGRFRMETNKPLKQIIIVNKKTLWIYDIELAQASKQTLTNAHGMNPVFLLSGDAKVITNDFVVFQVSMMDGLWFRLTPKKADYPFKSVMMQFSNNRLSRMRVVNNFGETSTFDFYNIKVNRRIPLSLFNFKPPRGVDVINQKS